MLRPVAIDQGEVEERLAGDVLARAEVEVVDGELGEIGRAGRDVDSMPGRRVRPILAAMARSAARPGEASISGSAIAAKASPSQASARTGGSFLSAMASCMAS